VFLPSIDDKKLSKTGQVIAQFPKVVEGRHAGLRMSRPYR
jgi:hypothetical protein